MMMRVNSKMCYSEVDPSGRYGRFNEILGKGAMKTVYKAFDEVFGMEVAWSQVLLNDLLHCPDELQRLYSEVHLLKNLNHESIIRFYNSWIDTDRRTFNFITEMLTSGTLREYRQKYKDVNIRAIKNWARQILRGLAHLHSLDPPVIHRDIKCDNIFVNGHLAQVKIGDLGLAAVLRGSQNAHSIIGTPEFMAPELYEEEYNELVDVYSYGMCVLEMLTSEYPYSECSNSAQIYKKVTAGKKPDAFYRIQNPKAKEFVAKCLEDASTRPSAHELLFDPFLADDDDDDNMPVPGTPVRIYCPKAGTVEAPFLFGNCIKSTFMTITGTVNSEDNTLFLKVQISDKSGSVRHVHFPFDIVKDTAIDVAIEMVKELDINDWEPQEIAEMIEEELSSLVPLWKDVNSPKSLQQHSFNYHDVDDDNENHPPCLSSRSPSHNSLTGFADPCEESSSHDPNSVYNYHVKGNLPNSEDSSSETSCSTVGYSDIEYSTQQTEPKAGVCSRLCPKINPTTMCNDKRIGLSGKPVKGLGSTSQKKFNKIRTFMDIRTQLLQRALMQAVSKRRSAKTVGAVENIGFHDPS